MGNGNLKGGCVTNKEIALEIFSQVEKKHCNLYFAISKENFFQVIALSTVSR